MKLYRILLSLASISLSQVALAELPFTSQTIGTMQGAADFCARIQPDKARIHREMAKRLVQGVTTEEIAEIMKADEYKAAYESLSNALVKVSFDQAVGACECFVRVIPYLVPVSREIIMSLYRSPDSTSRSD